MARRTNPRTNLSPVRNPRPIKVGPCTRTNRLIRVGVPIEVMTAINCSHEEGCTKRGGGASEREGEGFWARAELGLTGEMGLVVPGHVYLTPLFLFSSFSLSLSALLLLFQPVATVGSCPSARRFSFSCFLGRTCNSDATSLRSQMEDPVPGIERVKHRLKACFPTGNRWENNGPTAPKVSDKCSARVAHPGPRTSRILFFFPFFLTCEKFGWRSRIIYTWTIVEPWCFFFFFFFWKGGRGFGKG